MIEKEDYTFTAPSHDDNSFLFGHKEQIAFLLNCIRTKQIPNAWLFHGPVGIGKASLALNVAKILSNNSVLKKDSLGYLSEKDIRNPNASIRVNNIFFCKRKWDDKKKLFQKNISIDDIRELSRKFYLSSADNSYKVCIVDTTEDLNISASNSLLKMLEEPPKDTLFILVSNNKQSILPTILSRCQKIGFQRLNEDDLRNISAGLFEQNHFDLLTRAGALTSCDGSVKKLLNFLDKDYVKFFNSMKELLLDLPNLNKRKAIKLLTGNREYLGNDDPDKSAFGVLLKLLASLAKNEIDLLINNKSVKEEINIIAAHLYPQISLLRHQSMEYNVEAKKVLFLALNMIESAFEKYKK
jgi:DNA polymerase-3 subunit delta'